MPFSASSSWSALRIIASRAVSWAPSAPRDLRPYCFKRKPPASLISNSASLRLPAPKSTARNDFVFSIYGCDIRPTKPGPPELGQPADGRWWLQETPVRVKWKEIFSAKEKTKGAGAQRFGNEANYHAAQFHDQSIIFNKNHAKGFCAAFAAIAGARRVKFTHNACGPRIQPLAGTSGEGRLGAAHTFRRKYSM